MRSNEVNTGAFFSPERGTEGWFCAIEFQKPLCLAFGGCGRGLMTMELQFSRWNNQKKWGKWSCGCSRDSFCRIYHVQERVSLDVYLFDWFTETTRKEKIMKRGLRMFDWWTFDFDASRYIHKLLCLSPSLLGSCSSLFFSSSSSSSHFLLPFSSSLLFFFFSSPLLRLLVLSSSPLPLLIKAKRISLLVFHLFARFETYHEMIFFDQLINQNRHRIVSII